jgi:hypothetical protein
MSVKSFVLHVGIEEFTVVHTNAEIGEKPLNVSFIVNIMTQQTNVTSYLSTKPY